jgi:Spy/CpxP family protein refolding chaperone
MFKAKALLALGMVAAASAAEPTPHAASQEHGIKALSPEQIENYLTGRGMGMALPAELNGYPGPRHVLELADELDLTAAQRARTEQLFEDMRLKAVALGEEIVAREALLDELFASGTASEAALDDLTEALGRLNGQLRAHHLRHHLAMRDLLDPRQIDRYQRLRGYGSSHGSVGHERHGGH